MKKVLRAKISAWYAAVVAVSVGCLASVFSCRAIMECATDGWRIVAKATMLAACVAAYLVLVAFAFGAMRKKKSTLPYFAAMLLVGVTTFIVKFFYMV